MNITPVILCGGSGTRLWPLSRQSFPKQFVPLIGDKSLLRLTLERLAWCGNAPLCVASEDHRFLVADAMESAGLTPDHAEITFRADNDISVQGDTALQVKKLLDMLEDLDDVQDVYSNADLGADVYA